ncbi:hypothetical protein POSPLADRAFT_1181682 [Postia placenta MAD-698-R-SB12]|uniref:SAP domain-containing protein n=1 Tax=Postia placenta MAD-698-R-SB12 TaxID=670580 RepID=A0A1X6MZ41_9APHY|nr:hypothetical protein POSPLADRAFT_1181682 [Postia placenta MAD-698-R-SB12]OSX61629.1 hypothetical protein POSPLADRAFT_1181682 [Postia placenta MAD-698-R-SB12]
MTARDDTIDQVYDAYRRLTHDQLVLFLKVRSLPTIGTDDELASRLAQYDLHTYHLYPAMNGLMVNGVASPSLCPSPLDPPKQRQRPVMALDLPVEILAEIMDHVGDWELAKAVGVPTSLPEPLEWHRATPSDHAILTGYLPLVRATDPIAHPPTRLGAVLAARFSYVNVLEYFFTQHRQMFLRMYRNDLLPITASLHGRTAVLLWWKHTREQHPEILPPPKQSSVAEAIDGASRNGQVASLDWWLFSGLPLEFTETALESASAKNQILVLNWWKQQFTARGLPLKIGRVMDMASTAGHVEALEWWARSALDFKYDRQALYHASCHGKVDVLQWWLNSGLQLIFDPDALTGATRHNRPDVLEWWDKSGLPIQYRMCDIEEALEDAIGGGEAAREWWRRKGVDFNANDKEWMKLQVLN